MCYPVPVFVFYDVFVCIVSRSKYKMEKKNLIIKKMHCLIDNKTNKEHSLKIQLFLIFLESGAAEHNLQSLH